MTLTLISFGIFLTYLTYALLHIGHVPHSLSETFYLIPHKWMFSAMMGAIALTLLPAMLDATPEDRQFLIFLALSAICFVGAAPNFYEEDVYKVHTSAAIAAAFFGILWVVLSVHWWIPVVCLAVILATAFLTRTYSGNGVFYWEMVAFASVYLAALMV